MPHLENEVWNRFKDKGVVVLAIGREHNTDELQKFQAANNVTLPMLVDPKREIYSKYAKKSIPRNYVIDAQGKIVFASLGFRQDEFNKMVKLIEGLTGSASAAGASSSEPTRPQSPNPLKMAMDDITNNNLASAMKSLHEIINKAPDNAQAHYLLGIAYAKAKNYSSAKEEYSAALRHANDPHLKELAIRGLSKVQSNQAGN